MATAPTPHEQAKPTNDKSKLPEDFKPNEPVAKSGTDDKGQPDGSLSEDQVIRAATEAMIASRPQPTVEQMDTVYGKLREKDDKGHPKHKYKTAKEAGEAAVAALSSK